MINILLFAEVREIIGKEKLEIELASSTVAELKNKLQLEYGLANLNKMMFAVNEVYANDEQIIKSGDTVAIIPPVSGG